MKTLSRLFAVVVVGVSCLQIFAAPEPGLKQYRLKWSSGNKYFTPDDWQTAWDGNDPVVMPGALMAKKANMSGTTWKGVSYPFANYSGYWYEGYIKLEGGKTYSAKSAFDDGGCVYIDGQMVYQQGSTSGYSGASPSFTPVPFVCNKSGWYKLQLGMWDWGGGRNIFSGTIAIVQWSDGDPAVVVTDYSAKYWNEFWDADSEGTALGTYLYTELPDSVVTTLNKNALDSYTVRTVYIGAGAMVRPCWTADGEAHWGTAVAMADGQTNDFVLAGLPMDKSIGFFVECVGTAVTSTNVAGSAYTGNVSASAGVNAKEKDGTPGTIIVSRANVASAIADPLTIAYTVDLSSTAVPGIDYKPLSGTAVIPAGSASVAIEIHPYARPEISESRTVSITIANGNYGITTPSASTTIENDDFSAPIRYVDAKNGSDSDNGLNPNNPYKTIWYAVNEFSGYSSITSYVYVAPGTYSETNTSYAVTLSNAIEVVGASGNPADVIVKATGAGNNGIFKLKNAGAAVRNLTMYGGRGSNGGNANISAGLIENCILENGYATAWNGGGGNLYCSGGRVSRCVLKGGYTSSTSTAAGRQIGGGFYLSGGVIESCLVVSNKNSYAAAGRIDGAGTLLNCTITGNKNEKTSDTESGPIVYLSNAKAKMINCAIYGNTVANDPTGISAFYGLSSVVPASAVENCPLTLTDADFNDYAGGDFTPSKSGNLTDVGIDYATSGGVSDKDVKGLARVSGGYVDIGAYEFQYSASFMLFDGKPTFRWSQTAEALQFSVKLKTGSGSIYALFTDAYSGVVHTNLVTDSASAGNTYTLTPSIPENRNYYVAAYGVSDDGDETLVTGDENTYFGEISVVKGSDAYEATFKSGAFVVSRADGDASTYSDLTVDFILGGTATPGLEYKEIPLSVVIPAQQASVTVNISPLVCPSVTQDRTVTLTLTPCMFRTGSSASAQLTLFNDPNPYTGAMRFVSEDGDDGNSGLSLADAFATVAHAVEDLGTVGGRVYVNAGTYPEPTTPTAVVVTNPVEVVGMTGDPKDVIVTRGSSDARIFMVNHPSAVLRYLTIKDGRITSHGGQGPNVFIKDGIIEDCIITGGYNSGNGGNEAGANLYETGGLVRRCVISNGNIPSFASGRANRKGGVGFVLDGGILENSLITGNVGGLAAGMVFGSGEVFNCTIVGNNCPCGGVIMLKIGNNVGKVSNSIIYGNTSNRSNAPDTLKCYVDQSNDWGIDFTGSGFGKNNLTNAFDNCLGEVQINSRCMAGNPYYRDAAHGDYRIGQNCPAYNAVPNYSVSGATSTTDLFGKTRVVDGYAELGAYEFQLDDPYAEIRFSTSGLTTPVTLTANASLNAISGKVVYKWDIDDDGVYEIVKTNDSSLVATFDSAAIRNRIIAMKVETEAFGTITSASRTFEVYPAIVYVNQDSTGALAPYETRETAATLLTDGVAAAGSGTRILIAPGTYPQAHQSVITFPMSIVGESGKPEDVIIRNTSGMTYAAEAYRLFRIDNPDVFLANVSIVDGGAYAFTGSNEGGGIRMTGGVVSNCVIRNCQGRQGSNPQPLGGGIYMNGTDSLVTHCVVSNCSASGDAAWLGFMGSGIHVVKGRVENTLVANCRDRVFTQPEVQKTIGGIYTENGNVVNCTVVNCKGSKAGGIFVNGSAVVSNTVAFNDYKILKTSADPLTVVTNVCDFLGTETQFVHSLSNVTAAAFADYANCDFRPSPTGALFNAGINISGWDKLTDLDGKKRIVRGTIDVGCYEYQTRNGMNVILR